MTVSRRTMLLLILTLAALLLVSAWAADPGRSENYGGRSAAYQARREHEIRLWFNKTGDADRMVCIVRYESAFSPTAYNDDDFPVVRFGEFQITHPLWAQGPARGLNRLEFQRMMARPVQSIRLAWWIYRTQGGLRQWRHQLRENGGHC